MSNPSKRKGSAWETTLRDYLIELGYAVHRNPTNGAFDIGDLALQYQQHHYVIEAKATKAIDLPGFLSEAETEADNYAQLNRLHLDQVSPLVIVKRRNKSVQQAYVVQELEWWLNDLHR